MSNKRRIRIAIASGKGGTGKTLISISLFYTLQQLGIEVTLVDCDTEEPNVLLFFKGKELLVRDVTQKIPVIDESKCLFCSKCQDYCNYNSIFILNSLNKIRIIEELCHGCGACSYVCGTGAITEKDISLGKISRFRSDSNSFIVEGTTKVGVFSPVSVIKCAIKEADNDNLVIMDSPPGTSCPFIQTVNKADYVILVTEPTPFGLSDLKLSAETLKSMNKPYGIIVNKAGLGNDDVYSYIKNENLKLLLEIPFDKSIAALYSMGEIVAKHKKEWRLEFANIFNEILETYGNCNNQR